MFTSKLENTPPFQTSRMPVKVDHLLGSKATGNKFTKIGILRNHNAIMLENIYKTATTNTWRKSDVSTLKINF